MDYESLIKLNKEHLYAKLDKVQKINKLYVAGDLIEVVSQQKERDKRIINGYTQDELVTHKIKRKDGLKTVRMFTKAGIARYLAEGKLYDLKSTSEYFSIQVVKPDPLAESLKKCHVELEQQDEVKNDETTKDKVKHAEPQKLYKTKALLKWLFGKRKSCKQLGETTDLASVIELFSDDDSVIDERFRFLTSLTS